MGLAALGVFSLSPAAHAQLLAAYTSNQTDLHNVMRSVGSSQLPLEGTYVDSSIQFGPADGSSWGFVKSARYSASTLVPTCPPSSCSPLVGLPMAGAGQDAGQAFQSIANGSQDGMIKGVLQAYADQGYKNIILRPGFEMNGGWFSWTVTQANAASFKAAFQRIADISHNFTGASVSVNFNPNSGRSIPLQDYYPGNSYVDSIGIDIYGEPWQSDGAPNAKDGSPTNLTFDYLAQFAKDNGKPFAIPEAGSATNDAAFAKNLAAEIKATNTPVQFLGLWDNDGVGPATWSNDANASAAWGQLASVVAASPASLPFFGAGGGDAPPPPPLVPFQPDPSAPARPYLTSLIEPTLPQPEFNLGVIVRQGAQTPAQIPPLCVQITRPDGSGECAAMVPQNSLAVIQAPAWWQQ